MPVENQDYVKCQICGFEGEMLNRHLAKHNITAKEYREKFPESLVSCRFAMERQSNSVSKTWDAKPVVEKPIMDYACPYCGGKFNHLCNLQLHLKKEDRLFIKGKEGEDFVVCKICGMRSESLEPHIRMTHKMSIEGYRASYPGETSSDNWKKQMVVSQTGKHTIPTGDRSGATTCDKCGQCYLQRFSATHLSECVSSHPDKYIEGQDYVKCPECQKAFLSVGRHLREIHGWDNDKIVIETGRGLKLIADRVVEKIVKATDYKAAQVKREQTHLERHGFANPFADPATKEKIVETSQRRYGSDHPMQNEEVLIRQNESAQNGPSAQEVFFDEHTCDSVVFTGYGGRFVRVKIGVHKYGRVVKNLNPDFMVFPDNVLESALLASKERRRLSREKHRSKYVIELLGDWYHSEQMIGVKPEEHEAEIVAAYKSVGIECLTLWEKDVMGRWEIIRPMVDAWVAKAVADMNEHPIFSRATKNKVDKRIGTLACPWGSGRVFREQAALDRWMASPVNFWRPGMLEGKEYVRCLECPNVRVGKIGEHLRQIHGGMSKEDYLAKHPGALMVSSRVVDLLGQNAKDRVGNTNVKRTAYRCPDGSIVGRRDAWIRAWGVENPPADSIVDGSLYNPWSGKVVGEDFCICAHCGYRASNLARHLRREHGGLEGYTGQVKSKKCVESLSAGAYAAWDTKGRSSERDTSQNKTHKDHGLTGEKLTEMYEGQSLSDAKIGQSCGLSGGGVAYLRKKFGIATNRVKSAVIEGKITVPMAAVKYGVPERTISEWFANVSCEVAGKTKYYPQDEVDKVVLGHTPDPVKHIGTKELMVVMGKNNFRQVTGWFNERGIGPEIRFERMGYYNREAALKAWNGVGEDVIVSLPVSPS
jgi:predicted transcriptional regulator